MAVCLYDPKEGFFSSGPLRSSESGDFLTSPEISPAFGATLARFAIEERTNFSADEFVVAELGAGSGSLMGPLLEELDDTEAISYAIEASPAARATIRNRIPGIRVGTTLEDLPHQFSGIVFANELLDNLPMRIAVRRDAGWEERFVGIQGDHLVFVASDPRDDTVAWADTYGGVVAPGGSIEVQLQAAAYIESVLERLHSGTFVAIDYGGTAKELEPRRTQGTLRTYRAHHLGPDTLMEPGMIDITADVNFTAMEAAASRAGAMVALHRQDDFLSEYGLCDHIRGLREQEVVAGSDSALAMKRLRLRDRRINAETLIHPRGLGDFRVLVMRVEHS